MTLPDCMEKDKEWTLTNKEKLLRNKNLLLWYEKLYQRQFAFIGNIDAKNVLEIGGPLFFMSDSCYDF